MVLAAVAVFHAALELDTLPAGQRMTLEKPVQCVTAAVRTLHEHRAPHDQRRDTCERGRRPHVFGWGSDLVADSPRMVAGGNPCRAVQVQAFAVDLRPTVRDARLVVSDDVSFESCTVGTAAMLVAVLQERRNCRLERPVERDRLRAVGFETEPHRAQRFDHVVLNRADAGRVVRRKFSRGPHRPLFDTSRHTGVSVEDIAVRVFPDAEAELERTVSSACHRTDLLGPGPVRLRHRRERVGNLMVERLVGGNERSDGGSRHVA